MITRVALAYQAPCDVAGLLAFLAARAVPGVEMVSDGVYRRSLRLPGGPGVVALAQADGSVEATLHLTSPSDRDEAVARCRCLLDLDADPQAILGVLGGDPLIGAAVAANPGRRVPGHVDGAELAVRAVLGQQVSVAGAATLAGRLVARYGEPLDDGKDGVTHLFPSAKALAAAVPEAMSIPRARGRALIGLASALADGQVELGGDMAPAEVRRRLLELPGIGPWTADYIAIRVLGDRDAFLPTDLGVRRGLRAYGCDHRPAAALELSQRWRPYRAYAMLHLWAAPGPGQASSGGSARGPSG